MKSFGLVSAILSAAGVVSAYTQPVNGPVGNPINQPGFHEKVPVGKPYTITWTPNHCLDSTVTLLFLKGPSNNIIPQYPIVEKTGNSGSYVWTPDASLPDSNEGYGIQLVCDSNGDYQWSTQFGFANDGAVVDTTTTTEAASTTTTAAADTTTEESDYPTTTTEESDYPTTTTTAEEEEETTTEESDYPTTSTTPYANTTTTVHTTTSTTTTTEVEATTTEIEYDDEEPTEEPTTLATITYAPTNSTKPPSNTTTLTIPTQSDSGVAKNVASFGVALVALAVAGFSLF